jgi:hypothetical protein
MEEKTYFETMRDKIIKEGIEEVKKIKGEIPRLEALNVLLGKVNIECFNDLDKRLRKLEGKTK